MNPDTNPNLSDLWQRTAQPPRLRDGEVHLWLASLNLAAQAEAHAWSLLDGDEAARARRFVFERDRRRFVAARATLRLLLARYLQRSPQRIAFAYGPRGKPRLAASAPGGAPALRFNLAHSNELALYAFTLNREVGVDLEHIRPMPDLDAIARSFFSAGERAALDAIPAGEARTVAFYACWTRKEAFVKLLGDGLSYPLDAFCVSLAEQGASLLQSVNGVEDAAARWTIAALTPAPGYVAALAVEGTPGAISAFRVGETWLAAPA